MSRKKQKDPPESAGITCLYKNPSGVSSDHKEQRQMFYTYTDELSQIHMIHSDFHTNFADHTHEFAEIICITEGCGIHHLDGAQFRVQRGDMFLIDYGMHHSFELISEKLSVINCIFHPEFLGGNFPALNSTVQLLSYLHSHKLLAETDPALCQKNLHPSTWDSVSFFEDMMQEYHAQEDDYRTVLHSMLSVLLIRLSRAFFAEKKKEETVSVETPFSRYLPEIIHRLNQNPPGSISAKMLADQYYMSQSAFSIHFRRAMGCTFHDYVTNLRIRHACALLLTTDCSVSEIQMQCGYRDVKSFYHAFRDYTGTTPLKYKAISKHIKPEETII